MAKVVVRKGGAVFETTVNTQSDIRDFIWLGMFKELEKYLKEHGHQRIPQDEESSNYMPGNEKLHRWCSFQKSMYKKGNLADWRYAMLVKAGFQFTPLETFWLGKYNELKNYKEKYGHCNFSGNNPAIKKLAKWFTAQKFNKDKLSPERFKLLNDIGINWDVKITEWDEMYNWLREYYIENGVPYVSKGKTKGGPDNNLIKLNRWCGRQVWRYRRGKLSDDRLKLLQDIGFNFNINYTIKITRWNKFFDKLIAFKDKYGHFNVPFIWQEDMAFTHWVQRIRNHKDKLSQDQIKQLDDIGFIWSFTDAIFWKNFNLLKQYKEKYGHCNVLPSQDRKLYGWINYLRKSKREKFESRLKDYMINELDNIGLDWDTTNTTFWETRIRELRDFKKEYGHTNVKNTSEHKQLYSWCIKLRRRRSRLTDDQIKSLNKLGFIW
jgi:hypothetical protein